MPAAYISRARVGPGHPQNLSQANVPPAASVSNVVNSVYIPIDADAKQTIWPDTPQMGLWSILNPDGSGKIIRLQRLQFITLACGQPLQSATPPVAAKVAVMQVSGVSGGTAVPWLTHDSGASATTVGLVAGASFTVGAPYVSIGYTPATFSPAIASGVDVLTQSQGYTVFFPDRRPASALRNISGPTHQTSITVREGEAIGITAVDYPSPAQYELSVLVDIGGTTYTAMVMVGGGVDSAPLIMTNPVGSGVVAKLVQVGVATFCPNTTPLLTLTRIEQHYGGTVITETKLDTSSPSSVADTRLEALHVPAGTKYGAHSVKAFWRAGECGNGPLLNSYGNTVLQVNRPIDFVGRASAPEMVLRPGEGLALHQRSLSAYGIGEVVAQYSVEDLPASVIFCMMD